MSDIVNTGTAPNSGDGDALRTAMQKINNRFLQFEGNIDLNQRFQGAAATDPTVRLVGGALQDGDWYLNTTLGSYKIRISGVWSVAPDILASDYAAPSGATLIGHLATGATELRTLAAILNDNRTVESYRIAADTNDANSFLRMAAATGGNIRLLDKEYVVGQINFPAYDRMSIIGRGMPKAAGGLDKLQTGTVIVGGMALRANTVHLEGFGMDSGSARGATGAADGLVVNAKTGEIGIEATVLNVAALGPTAAGTTHAILVQGYSRGRADNIYCGKHQFGLVVKCRNFIIANVSGDDCRTALVYPKSDISSVAGNVADGTAGAFEITNVRHSASLSNVDASAVYCHASTASFASARIANVSQSSGLAALRIQAGGLITDPAISGVNATNIRGEGSQHAVYVGGFTYDWSVSNVEAVNPPTGRAIIMDSNSYGWSIDGVRCLISNSSITADVVMTVYGTGAWNNIVVRNPFLTMKVHEAWAQFSTIKSGNIAGQCRNTYDQALAGANGSSPDAAAVPTMRILPGSVLKLEGRFNMTAAANKFFCNLPAGTGTGKQLVFACGAIDSGGNYVTQAVRLNDGQLSVEPTLPAGLQRIDVSNIMVQL